MSNSELPDGWCWTTLGTLAEFINGDRGKNYPSSDAFVPSGVPFINAGHLRDGTIDLREMNYINEDCFERLGSGKVRPQDVLYCLRGSLGKSAVVTNIEKGAIASSLVIIRPVTGIEPRFLYYFVVSPLSEREVIVYNNGTAQPNLSAKNLKEFRLPFPPVNEQRRIVAKIEELFSDLDAGVAALKRAKANLKRYRAAVLKAAVEGKLTEEWRAKHPHTEPASKLLTRILNERRQKWEADQLAKFATARKEPPKGWREKYVEPSPPNMAELTDVPEGWCWATADQLTTLITDGEHITPLRSESGVYLLSARNVLDGRLCLDDVDYVPKDVHALLAKRLDPQPGDVLLSCSGSVGRACVVPFGVTFSLVRSVAVLRTLFDQGEYCCLALRSIVLQRQINEKKTQTAQANIFQGKIRKLVFPLPPAREQSQIVGEAAERLSQIEAAEVAIENGLARSARLRQSILKQAFEGKLIPQDPHDEPASVLLERLLGCQSVHTRNGEGTVAVLRRGGRVTKSHRSEGRANE